MPAAATTRSGLGSVFTAGTILDGGSEFAGGVDQLTLLGLGASDLRPADIVDVEQLSFGFGGQTAILDGDQVGGGGFTRIRGAGNELVDGHRRTTSTSPA